MTHVPMNEEKKKGTKSLFFIQIFSTLSFSVLYSTLVIYVTKGLHIDPDTGVAITGGFVAFNYFLHLVGGYIGGRYLSYRALFGIGMLLQMVGCAILSIGNLDSMFWGLAPFLAGCGLNVTCVNCMLTQLFDPHDKNRESAFLWNYSGMNIGFLIGFTMSGIFQMEGSYSPLFLAAGVGNLVALIAVLVNWKVLRDKDTHLSHTSPKKHLSLGIIGVGMIVVLIFALRWLLNHAVFSNDFILGVGILMIAVVIALTTQQRSKEAAKKMWGFFFLLLASLIFWTLYQMIPMGLTLFITNNVDRQIFYFTFPPQWFLNINTIIIILGGPLMAHACKKIREKGYVIRIPIQFSVALFLIGVALSVLPLGIHFAGPDGKTAFGWVVFSFILLSMGELFISPIGYAMIGQLIPSKLQGLMMGTWLMIVGVAATLSNYFSRMSIDKDTINNLTLSNKHYAETFSILGWSAIVAGVILLLLTPFLKKLIQEKKPHETPHPYNAPQDTPD